jgi:hypothetical protein
MTANSDIQRLMNNLRVSLPGAIDSAMQLEIFNVMNDFFQSTKAWQEDIPFTTVVARTSYDIVPASVSQIDSLMVVLDPNSFPVDAAMQIPGTVTLRVSPTVVQQLVATVALTITDPVDRDNYPVFPQWLLSKHNDTIKSGVLARMMAQPAKPYTNAALATFHQRNFDGGCSKARIEARRKNTFGTQTWRFPSSFGVRRRRGF